MKPSGTSRVGATTALCVSVAGFLIVAGLTASAVSWRGAENYAALAATIGGLWVGVVQIVCTVLVLMFNKSLDAGLRTPLVALACLLPVLTGAMIYISGS